MNIALYALLALPAAPQDWHAVELPTMSVEVEPAPAFAGLADGRHVLLGHTGPAAPAESAPALPQSQVRQMIEAEARRQDRPLRFYPGSPPLLVDGAAEDRAWLSAVLGELQDSGERGRIEISALLVPASGAAAGDGELPSGGRAWRGQVRSGGELAFGRRTDGSFLASFDVEVAQDEGVAAPLLGRILTGETLNVVAYRVDAGRSVHLRGVLDLARLRASEAFDPGTPDLGAVTQPFVDLVQVHFSGVVESGGALTVRLQGAPLERPDWVLSLRATTRADTPQAPEAGWRVADLAFLAAPPSRLPAWRASSGFRGRSAASRTAAALPALADPAIPVSPSGLDSLSSDGGRRSPRSEPPPYWTERLLFVHATDAERWDRTRGLRRAMEAARLRTARVELAAGDLEVSLPVAAGVPARVLVGTERTFLADYDAEVAPDVSMPYPVVERWFEGLAWQGQLSSRSLQAELRTTHTEAVVVAPRSVAVLGDLQLPTRSVRARVLSLELGAPPVVALAADAGASEVTVRCVEP
ncbi:MAG: hypothetical protein QF903_08390 [Planctomycetota bacterium]|nr:hypothetical protein [Planctomycetota bacterium]MDP6989484.1 hypothetical protein [Planctomycetota bacterium]